MEIKFLTPVQLWQDFDCNREPLEISVAYNINIGNASVKGIYFTAVREGENSIRAFAEIIVPNTPSKKAIIGVQIAGELDRSGEFYRNFTDKGYIIATVNLSGKADMGKDATIYSAGFSYASSEAGKPAKFLATPSAAASPVFLWARIVRRFISVLQYLYPKAQPTIMGIKEAVDIIWPVAAMDSRVHAMISLLGKYPDSFRRDKGELDGNMERWEAAISAKANARFVTKPCLIVSSACAEDGDINRVSEVVAQIQEGVPFSMTISAGLSTQIDQTTLNSMLKWIDNNYSTQKEFISTPELTAVPSPEAVSFELKAFKAKKASTAILYYAYNESNPEFRNWHAVNMAHTSEDVWQAVMPVADCDSMVFAYAEVKYREGLSLASKELSIAVTGSKRIVKSHFLCDTSMEHGFYADTSSAQLVLSDGTFMIDSSSDGIDGFTAKDGNIATNIVSETRKYNPAGLFQIGVYSAQKVNVQIMLHKQEDDGILTYTAIAEVSGGEWQNLSLSCDDFKTSERIPMKDWDNLLRLTLLSVKGVLFNNMLWV